MGQAASQCVTGQDNLDNWELIPSQAEPLTRPSPVYVDQSGEAVKVSAAVTLHIYDLGKNEDTQTLNRVLRVFGTGIFHCAVEVYGREWSFRGTRGEGTGVFACKPKRCDSHTFCESVSMGDTVLAEQEILRLLKLLEIEWPGRAYSTLRQNCCHFSNKLCQLMGVGSIPSWVKSAAEAAAAISDEVGGIPALESRRPQPQQQQQQSPPRSPAPTLNMWGGTVPEPPPVLRRGPAGSGPPNVFSPSRVVLDPRGGLTAEDVALAQGNYIPVGRRY
mmetsp:Transcript_57141/g.150380  ORF Transcript_57141/g.150380 Transcript_57141/m.150380 type:complete len:275 (+) Transcript_57141:166-990(+)